MSKNIFYSGILVFFMIFIYFSRFSPKEQGAFKYFSADCSIYSKGGKILFHTSEQYCAFADDGKMLASTPDSNLLVLKSVKNDILWTSNEYAHHDLKFTDDQMAFLSITAESVKLKGKRVKSDCFSKRSLDNKIIHEWCLSKNIAKLERLGFKFGPALSDDSTDYARNRIINTPYEISHANSIYEIPENINSGNPALRRGNYLIHLYLPSYALLILDPEMKEILWTKNLGKITNGPDELLRLMTHDHQVTPAGKILSYVNWYRTSRISQPLREEDIRHVSLMKLDPLTDKIEWLYQEPKSRPDYASIVQGSVEVLTNGNILYSVVSDASQKSELYEIDMHGEIKWSFELPEDRKIKTTMRIKKAKAIPIGGFLKARGISD